MKRNGETYVESVANAAATSTDTTGTATPSKKKHHSSDVSSDVSTDTTESTESSSKHGKHGHHGDDSETTTTTDTNGLATTNANRIAGINNLYDTQKNNTLSELKTAYDQNMSDAQAAYDKISPQYQTSMNELSAEYERQRRNNNMAAAGNGLNTGAGSQMNLAQSAAYQSNQADLAEAENEALNDANKNILDLKTTYQNDITSAINSNDYQRAAALLDEYNNAYTRQTEQAKALAEFGDFSGYQGIWSQAQIDAAAKSWALQNPDLAYTVGSITADEYFSMTGEWPNGYEDGSSDSGSSGNSYEDQQYIYSVRSAANSGVSTNVALGQQADAARAAGVEDTYLGVYAR